MGGRSGGSARGGRGRERAPERERPPPRPARRPLCSPSPSPARQPRPPASTAPPRGDPALPGKGGDPRTAPAGAHPERIRRCHSERVPELQGLGFSRGGAGIVPILPISAEQREIAAQIERGGGGAGPGARAVQEQVHGSSRHRPTGRFHMSAVALVKEILIGVLLILGSAVQLGRGHNCSLLHFRPFLNFSV